MEKCLGKDRNNDCCRNNQLDESKFCKFHQYMNDYTNVMLNNLTLCSGCKKMYYILEGKQCDKCIKRGEENRIKNKNNIVLCIKEGCSFKKSEENDYCGKHQQEYFKKQTEKIGKKVCSNYIRGCRIQLDKFDTYSRCLECRKKERVKNKENEIIGQFVFLNDDIILNNETIKSVRDNKIIIIENEEEKIPNKISTLYSSDIISEIDNNLPIGKNIGSINRIYIVPEYIVGTTKILYEIIEEFDNLGIDYPLANILMEYNYKINNILKYIDATKKDGKFNLDKIKTCSNAKCKKDMPEYAYIDKFNRIVNQCLVCRLHAQVKSKRQTRINSKTLWKKENYEKCAKYWLDSRGRQIENKGVEKYLEDNAKYAKNWRVKNPEKQKEINEKKKNDIIQNHKIYLRDSYKKNIEFLFTFEEYTNLVKTPCFYCGTIQHKLFNGIDKMNCYKDYIKENCVSCCSTCNKIKGTLTPDVLIKRIEHILTFNNIIKCNLYPKMFDNHNVTSFSEYQKRAQKIKKVFELTKNDYLNLIIKNCYICGKETNFEHTNGIDRIDNNKGYTMTNVKSCCAECNYSKNNLHFLDYLTKLKQIYEYQQKTLNIVNKYLDKISITNIKIRHLNKKKKEELVKITNIKKNKRKEQLIEKYTNDEYKNNKANEMANLKKNNNC